MLNNQSSSENLNPEFLAAINLINNFYRYNPNGNSRGKWEKYDADSQTWNEVSKHSLKFVMTKSYQEANGKYNGKYKRLTRSIIDNIQYHAFIEQDLIQKFLANSEQTASHIEEPSLNLNLLSEEVIELYKSGGYDDFEGIPDWVDSIIQSIASKARLN
ncbi:hypothetical protein [Myxosarcina sp. GI1(2024)]